ncbi:MAG: prolyl oligopeptidase family serine peptidase [Pseudomonadota bacterium]
MNEATPTSSSTSVAAMARETLPFGSWPSTISAESLVAGARGVSSLTADGETLYWLESRPEEAGRTTIMRRREDGVIEELLSAPFNVRTRVHEYGGGSYHVADGVVWFANFSDQRVYRMIPGEEPVPITPDTDFRYAGFVLDASRDRLISIREDHTVDGEPANALVAFSAKEESDQLVLFDGSDFVSAPSLSSDGERIAFVSWNHPNMPWDNTQLHSAGFAKDGALSQVRLHNPGQAESIIDPQWLASGALVVLTDRDNWWAPYEVDGEQFKAISLGLDQVEVGGPGWSIASSYQLHDERVGSIYIARQGAVETLYLRDLQGQLRPLDIGATGFGSMALIGERLYLTAGFADKPGALLAVNFDGELLETVRRTRDDALDPQWVPSFRQVSFPVGVDEVAHGVYLPPQSPKAQGPTGEAPPLIVTVHGGPTSVASAGYRPDHYFWTSRGFAILDLNYRGSTGYGREYRRALYSEWGVSDVEDAAAGARWLADQGLADTNQLLIRGGSAGGYTTLAAHAFSDTFAAGASYFGISDIEALARDTHKFESRYLDQLIGPYPEDKALYEKRSPIHHLEGFSAPLILLQGLDDPVVPPNQSEMIFEALRNRGVATAYVPFEGESHGFRKAENQIAARHAELYFYARVLGFDTAEELPGIPIENLE